MFRKILISIVLMLSTQHSFAESALSQVQFPQQTDPVLQDLAEQAFAQAPFKNLIDNKRLSIAILDVTDENKPKLSHLNGYETMYAASLPKIAILLAVFEEIDQGNLELTPEIQKSLEMMIRSSSNVEATRMYELVGADRIAEILQSDRYQFYDQENGGGLWVGKPYGKKQAWKRDPLRNVSHGANGIQVARFYFLMEQQKLTRPDYCPMMKEILSDSAINHKFVKGLKSKRPDAAIYRKSGTWRNYHSDSALIERQDGKKYIIVAITQDDGGSRLLEKVVVTVDDLIDRYHSREVTQLKNESALLVSGGQPQN